MSDRMIFGVLGGGFAIIIVLTVALFVIPAPVSAPTAFKSENVNIFIPLSGATVSKSFKVAGEARGTWYFEASFPLQVHDAANNRVGGGLARAQENWMTEKFVPFVADVKVGSYSGLATLVLLKDNPSGLPENDDSVSIPIVIK